MHSQVIAVKDVPGFYVNRCLGPTIVETVAMLQEGVDPLALNKALTDYGYPVGAVTLADEVGIDVANHVVGNLVGEQPKFLGVRMEGADMGMLSDFVSSGLLGRKTKRGFFDYSSTDKKAAKKARVCNRRVSMHSHGASATPPPPTRRPPRRARGPPRGRRVATVTRPPRGRRVDRRATTVVVTAVPRGRRVAGAPGGGGDHQRVLQGGQVVPLA